jgi:signal transduction histidine kinase
MLAAKFPALALTLVLAIVPTLQGGPRITRTLLIEAPQDFSLEEVDNLERIETFPSKPVDSIDSPGPRLGRLTWYKFELEQDVSSLSPNTSLRLLSAAHDRIEARLLESGRLIRSDGAGFKEPANRRRGHAINLTLPLNEWRTERAAVYVGVLTHQTIPVSPAILTEDELRAESDVTNRLTFVYFGGALVLLLVQGALFLHFRDPATRDYAFFSIGLIAIALAQSGLFDYYLGGSLAGFYLGDWRYHIRLLNCILGVRALGTYFALREKIPSWQRVLDLSVVAVVVLTAASSLLDISTFRIAVALVQIAAMVVLTITCALALRRRLIGAGMISTGWMGVLGVTIYLNLVQLSLAPPSSVTTWIAVAAALWELLFSTLALTHKFQIMAEIRHRKELQEIEISGMERTIRVMCHDLSGPLATIGMTTDLLELNQEAGRPVDLKATTSRLRSAFNALKEQIDSARNNELLRSQGGKLALELVDLCAAFNDAERTVQDKFGRKRITFRKTDWPESAPVLAEPRMLRLSIIANALSNAVKFSSSGGTIDVSLRREGGAMVLRIRDHGVGIPRELREAFERSGRIQSRPGTMNEEGTGFGMMLMRDFTKAMRGEFRLESRTAEESATDHGTTIEIRLPVAVAKDLTTS